MTPFLTKTRQNEAVTLLLTPFVKMMSRSFPEITENTYGGAFQPTPEKASDPVLSKSARNYIRFWKFASAKPFRCL